MPEQGDELVGAAPARSEVDAEVVELPRVPAHANAEIDSAFTELVESGQLASRQRRLSEARTVSDQKAEPGGDRGGVRRDDLALR